ncbi:PEP/pyruvate-binding domain-containing protein [Arthrobacter sp. ISL-72]|uniref:PEP/pyruvate-binding domain-containing protein n=1 Tax=Arthrobacter sp. ISL-72 TaxID=2819114 RepID=UPI001BEBA4AE|nr:PEP/pyruvate-binding domain-containing protein [Arthrobacter sp. ISL-72]MBT2594156.1 phosphoenolpyruvate synthase [Arthrobacter sp. ISL-72]
MLARVGGKAANLGETTAAGLPVPPGFCLTTDAYRSAVVPAGLEDVHRALAATGTDDLETLAGLAATARELILGVDIPEDIADAVRASYAALGTDVPVAVRSSATAEDLPFASFAGQQDTYLNVVGADAVLAAVRKCWASLWTDRAVTYRATHGISPSTVALAVVVQRMVDASVAGVLFTANPVTGRRPEAVIDASPGLGEAVVSGAVNPDHFVVDRATGEILERRPGDKGIAIRPLPGGGTERVNLAPASGPSLSDFQVRTLASLGSRVERHYGAPQDIEWAIDGTDKVWLTQSRPITTLYPLPEPRPDLPAREGTRLYLCFSLAQGLTRPLTPMGLAGFRLITSSAARAAGFDVPDPRNGPAPYRQAGLRLFFDLTAVIRSSVGRAIVPRVFDVMEARSAAVLRGLFADPRFTVTIKSPWRLVKHVGPVAVKARLPESLLRALLRPEAALRRVDGFGERLRDALVVPANATATERLNHAERILGEELFPIVPAVLPLPALGFALLAFAGKLAGGGAEPGALQAVLRGLPNNVTTEMDLALWQLATDIRSHQGAAAVFEELSPAELARRYRSGELPDVVQSGLAGFLSRYGHRAVAEIDLGMPRWSDDPAHILGVLANYLKLDDPTLAPDRQFAKAAREADARIEQLVARAGSRGGAAGRLRARLVRGALRRTRMFAGFRELPKYHIVEGLASVRQQLAAVGEELAAAGRINDAEDIFFLDFAEAQRGLTGEPMQRLVAERREIYDAELGRRRIPRVLLSDGTEPEAEGMRAARAGDGAAAGVLTGTPASAGTVTARARVIMDPQGARLEPGEILVAPSTDPGWTPLFLTAGGLVMEMGGPNSHGAVVAREYGIPAVVGVPDATSTITSGQVVTLDGGAGTVVPATG